MDKQSKLPEMSIGIGTVVVNFSFELMAELLSTMYKNTHWRSVPLLTCHTSNFPADIIYICSQIPVQQ